MFLQCWQKEQQKKMPAVLVVPRGVSLIMSVEGYTLYCNSFIQNNSYSLLYKRSTSVVFHSSHISI